MNIPLDIMIKDRTYKIEQLQVLQKKQVLKVVDGKVSKEYSDILFETFLLDTKIISYLANVNSALLSENEMMKEFCERKIKMEAIVK